MGWLANGPSQTAMYTTPVAAQLAAFAHIKTSENVLDVGTGTGVGAITSARMGASVTALDLTPTLLDAARENARIANSMTRFQHEISAGDRLATPPTATFSARR